MALEDGSSGIIDIQKRKKKDSVIFWGIIPGLFSKDFSSKKWGIDSYLVDSSTLEKVVNAMSEHLNKKGNDDWVVLSYCTWKVVTLLSRRKNILLF